MNATTVISRVLVAIISLFLITGIALSGDLKINGGGGTLNGTYNVNGNIVNTTASGIYDFTGTVNLTKATQSVGGGAQKISFSALNANGTDDKTQSCPVDVTAFAINNGNLKKWIVGANTLNIAGAASVAGGSLLDASSGSSIVNYTSGSGQTVLASTYGGTLGLSGAGAKSLGGAVSAALVNHTAASGALTVGQTFDITGASPSSLDAISVSAILTNSGSSSLTIASVSANSSTIRNTGAGSISFTAAPTLTAGTITASSGSLSFNSNNITVAGATLSLTGTGQANFGGSLARTSGTVTLSNSGTAVNYNGGSAQDVLGGITYFSLNMAGAGAKTVQTGDVTIANTGFFHNTTVTTDFGAHSLTLAGVATVDQTSGTVKFGAAGYIFASGTVEYNAAAGSQTIAGSATATYATLLLSGGGTKQVATGAAGTVHTTGSLTVNTGIILDVVGGGIVAVDGDLNVSGTGSITNAGTITVGL